MKNLIIASVITLSVAACNSKSADPRKDVVGVDTTGMYKNNIVADTARAEAILPAGTTKKVVETHSADGSVTTTTTTTSGEKKNTVPKTRAYSGTSSTTTQNNTAGNAQPTATTTRKSGWSNRAKGAAIGGVGGAVAGAVISKKKGKGALIGGAVGAAGGYIIGNEKDKREGR